jgi:hypothetical protein
VASLAVLFILLSSCRDNEPAPLTTVARPTATSILGSSPPVASPSLTPVELADVNPSPTAAPPAATAAAAATQVAQPSPTLTPSAAPLPWLHVADGKFVDDAGNVVYLRGFVTTLNNADGTPVNYTLDDYRRMQAAGANVQSIRIELANFGFGPGATVDPTYVDRIQQMIRLASQAGMYSELKMTVYETKPFRGVNEWQGWQDFWQDADGYQEQFFQIWSTLFALEADNSAVVGYDLLNEPQQGDLPGTTSDFLVQYLNPFYQRGIDLLRQSDTRHLVYFQPPYIPDEAPYSPYSTTIDRDQVVFAPHLFPNYFAYLTRGDLSTSAYKGTLDRREVEARRNKAPLFVEEYGMPWDPNNDGNPTEIEKYQVLERTITNLLVGAKASFTRPWWDDDRIGDTYATYPANHALVAGRSGLDGPPRSFIIDIFTAAVRGHADS